MPADLNGGRNDDGLSSKSVADEFLAHSNEEQAHPDQIAERIAIDSYREIVHFLDEATRPRAARWKRSWRWKRSTPTRWPTYLRTRAVKLPQSAAHLTLVKPRLGAAR